MSSDAPRFKKYQQDVLFPMDNISNKRLKSLHSKLFLYFCQVSKDKLNLSWKKNYEVVEYIANGNK